MSQRAPAGERAVKEKRLTPNLGSKMFEHSLTAHPICLVPFQTTWVKCDGLGFFGV